MSFPLIGKVMNSTQYGRDQRNEYFVESDDQTESPVKNLSVGEVIYISDESPVKDDPTQYSPIPANAKVKSPRYKRTWNKTSNYNLRRNDKIGSRMGKAIECLNKNLEDIEMIILSDGESSHKVISDDPVSAKKKLCLDDGHLQEENGQEKRSMEIKNHLDIKKQTERKLSDADQITNRDAVFILTDNPPSDPSDIPGYPASPDCSDSEESSTSGISSPERSPLIRVNDELNRGEARSEHSPVNVELNSRVAVNTEMSVGSSQNDSPDKKKLKFLPLPTSNVEQFCSLFLEEKCSKGGHQHRKVPEKKAACTDIHEKEMCLNQLAEQLDTKIDNQLLQTGEQCFQGDICQFSTVTEERQVMPPKKFNKVDKLKMIACVRLERIKVGNLPGVRPIEKTDKTAPPPIAKLPSICNFYLQGNCSQTTCPYRHDSLCLKESHVTSIIPSMKESHVTSITPSVKESHVTSITSAMKESHVTSITPSVKESHVTSITPSVKESHVTNITSAMKESHVTSITPSVKESHVTNITSSVKESHVTSITPSVKKSLVTNITSSVKESHVTRITPSVKENIFTNIIPPVKESRVTITAPPVKKTDMKGMCIPFYDSVCAMGNSCPFVHKKFPCKSLHIEGKCDLNDNCKFLHEPLSLKQGLYGPLSQRESKSRENLYRLHLNGRCIYEEYCPLVHKLFPCKAFHFDTHCFHGGDCEFSHEPLNYESQQILELMLEANEEEKQMSMSAGVPKTVQKEHSPEVARSIGQNSVVDVPIPIEKIRFYQLHLNGKCTKGNSCRLVHKKFPCKSFHVDAKCFQGGYCTFSHEPLNDQNRNILQQCLLPDGRGKVQSGNPVPSVSRPPSYIKEAAQTIIRPENKIHPIFDNALQPPRGGYTNNFHSPDIIPQMVRPIQMPFMEVPIMYPNLTSNDPRFMAYNRSQDGNPDNYRSNAIPQMVISNPTLFIEHPVRHPNLASKDPRLLSNIRSQEGNADNQMVGTIVPPIMELPIRHPNLKSNDPRLNIHSQDGMAENYLHNAIPQMIRPIQTPFPVVYPNVASKDPRLKSRSLSQEGKADNYMSQMVRPLQTPLMDLSVTHQSLTSNDTNIMTNSLSQEGNTDNYSLMDMEIEDYEETDHPVSNHSNGLKPNVEIPLQTPKIPFELLTPNKQQQATRTADSHYGGSAKKIAAIDSVYSSDIAELLTASLTKPLSQCLDESSHHMNEAVQLKVKQQEKESPLPDFESQPPLPKFESQPPLPKFEEPPPLPKFEEPPPLPEFEEPPPLPEFEEPPPLPEFEEPPPPPPPPPDLLPSDTAIMHRPSDQQNIVSTLTPFLELLASTSNNKESQNETQDKDAEFRSSLVNWINLVQEANSEDDVGESLTDALKVMLEGVHKKVEHKEQLPVPVQETIMVHKQVGHNEQLSVPVQETIMDVGYSSNVNNPCKKKARLCRLYLNSMCTEGDDCPFVHKDFPCMVFHTQKMCYEGDNCKFSHESLTDESLNMLEEFLNSVEGKDSAEYQVSSPHSYRESPPINHSREYAMRVSQTTHSTFYEREMKQPRSVNTKKLSDPMKDFLSVINKGIPWLQVPKSSDNNSETTITKQIFQLHEQLLDIKPNDPRQTYGHHQTSLHQHRSETAFVSQRKRSSRFDSEVQRSRSVDTLRSSDYQNSRSQSPHPRSNKYESRGYTGSRRKERH